MGMLYVWIACILTAIVILITLIFPWSLMIMDSMIAFIVEKKKKFRPKYFGIYNFYKERYEGHWTRDYNRVDENIVANLGVGLCIAWLFPLAIIVGIVYLAMLCMRFIYRVSKFAHRHKNNDNTEDVKISFR